MDLNKHILKSSYLNKDATWISFKKCSDDITWTTYSVCGKQHSMAQDPLESKFLDFSVAPRFMLPLLAVFAEPIILQKPSTQVTAGLVIMYKHA